jgi:hypothetical protein
MVEKYMIGKIIHNKLTYVDNLSEIYNFNSHLDDIKSPNLKKNIILIQEELLPTYSELNDIIHKLKQIDIYNTCFAILLLTEPINNSKSIYYKILTNELLIDISNIHIISTQKTNDECATNIHIPYFFTTVLRWKQTDLVNIKKNKLLSSFNRRINVSRSAVISKIINTFNLDEYVISYNSEGTNRDEYSINFYTNLFYSLGMNRDFYVNNTPIFIDLENIDNENMQQYMVLDQSYTCLFDLVNETISNSDVHEQNMLGDDIFFVTEKSFKPFASYQIPIFIANYNFYKNFKKLGFDLFEDIIPIDDIDQCFFIQKKIKIIFDFLVNFKKTNDYNSFFQNNIHRFRYNHNLLIEYRNKVQNTIDVFFSNIIELASN